MAHLINNNFSRDDDEDRGNAKRHKGDYEGAIEDYNKAIELFGKDNPDAAESYYNRGAAKKKKGDAVKEKEEKKKLYEDAREDYEMALRLNPELEITKNNLKNLKELLAKIG